MPEIIKWDDIEDLDVAYEKSRKQTMDDYYNALAEFQANWKKWDTKTLAEKTEELSYLRHRYRLLLWIENMGEFPSEQEEDVDNGQGETI